WFNDTFSSSGSATLVVTVNTAAQTFQATLTLEGNVFGTGMAPQTFSGSYAAGGTISTSSPAFGTVNLTVNADGSFSGSAPNIPNPNVSRMDFTGTGTTQQITINYTVTFAGGGGSASGRLILNHTG